MAAITLGTMIRGGEKTLRALDRFLPIGIETIQIFFWDRIPDSSDMKWIESIVSRCAESHVSLSALGLYANPLRDEDSRQKALKDWKRILRFAEEFAIPVVSGFTGRIPGKPVEISYEPIKSFFTPLIEEAAQKKMKFLFENCPMEGNLRTGDWNIAFLPEIWNVLFNEIFVSDAAGLEYDPGHCVQLGLPVEELMKEWISRIHHIHGKDATSELSRDFRFPGEGSADWNKICHILRESAYSGSIDLEGYHGKFTSHEAEIEKQIKSLEYLRSF